MTQPNTSTDWLEAWQEGQVSDRTFALYISKTLGELSEQKTEIDFLKDCARRVGARGAEIPGFEIGQPSSYDQVKADPKALLDLKDTIEAVNPDLWALIEQRVLSTTTVGRVASVKFIGSKKAVEAEDRRKTRNANRLAAELAAEDLL